MAATRTLAGLGIMVVLGGALLAACGGGDSADGSGGNAGGGGSSGGGGGGGIAGGSTTGGTRNPTCDKGTSTGEVQAPVYWKHLEGQTSWFASPVIQDLDGDGKRELIAAYYSVFVFDSQGNLLDKAEDGDGRVYAPHVVVDLEGDGTTEVVFGNSEKVYAYEWKAGKLALKAGWPVDTTTANNPPEVRGMAAADLGWRRQYRGRGHHHSNRHHRGRGSAGLRVLAQRPAVPTSGHLLASLAPVQQQDGRGERCGPKRRRASRLRLLRPQRGHRQHRRRSGAGDPGDLRQPPHPGFQLRRRRHRCLGLLHESSKRVRRRASDLGPVHPLRRCQSGGGPLPLAHAGIGRAPAPRSGCSGRRRRPTSSTWIWTARTRFSVFPTWRRTSRTRPRPTQSWCWRAPTGTAAALRCASRVGRCCRVAVRRSKWTATIRPAACRRRPPSTSRAGTSPRSWSA